MSSETTIDDQPLAPEFMGAGEALVEQPTLQAYNSVSASPLEGIAVVTLLAITVGLGVALVRELWGNRSAPRPAINKYVSRNPGW